jgi:hypothetical protein
VISKKTDVLGA